MHKKYFIVAVFLTIAIGVGSLITPPEIGVKKVQYADKAVHIIAYFLLALSWLLSLKKNTDTLKIIVSTFFYGIIIEVLQGILTNYRQADYLDMLANLVGIIIAFLLFNYYFAKNNRN